MGTLSPYTELGPPERMIPLGFHSRIHCDRARGRVDLAVDVGLAHPARDELGVLRAEIDDQDAVVMLGHSSIASWLGVRRRFSALARETARPAAPAAARPTSAPPSTITSAGRGRVL